jgi:hypothetical protein
VYGQSISIEIRVAELNIVICTHCSNMIHNLPGQSETRWIVKLMTVLFKRKCGKVQILDSFGVSHGSSKEILSSWKDFLEIIEIHQLKAISDLRWSSLCRDSLTWLIRRNEHCLLGCYDFSTSMQSINAMKKIDIYDLY